MKFHYVYQILNKENNKKYIGLRSSAIEPLLDLGYLYFSSSRDYNFINDQRENPHKYAYEIIKQFSTRKEAAAYEMELHDKYNVASNEEYYNKCNANSLKFNLMENLTEEHKEKISKSGKGRKLSIETREKMSKAQRGRIVSKESRNKQSKTMKGKYIGENHPMFGKNHSKEAKEKIGNSSKGRLHTEESKQKIREYLKDNHPTRGIPLSDEHKQKLSKSKMGTVPPNKGMPEKLVTCPHCNKEGGHNAMMRWHFNNCKYNKDK